VLKRFRGEGDIHVKFWFCDPGKAHLLTYLHQDPCGRLGCGQSKVGLQGYKKMYKWSNNFDERPHRRGDFYGGDLMRHSSASVEDKGIGAVVF